MKVSAKAEYACIAMMELAIQQGSVGPVRVKAIAEAHGVPLRFLVQILLHLKGAGLVTSTRGASGGYHLTRSPELITLADIVNVIDRPARPRSEDDQTGSWALQAIRQVWSEVQTEEQRILADVTLADLVHRFSRASSLSYQI